MKTYCAVEDLEGSSDELIAIRHSIHEHPEIGHKEFETARLVAEKLTAIYQYPLDILTLRLYSAVFDGDTGHFGAEVFDVRVFREEANFETEFDSSPVLTFVVPETGDYQFFVRKKRVKSPRSARFSISLAIK